MKENLSARYAGWWKMLFVASVLAALVTTCGGGFRAESDNADELGKPIFNTQGPPEDSLFVK